MTDNKTQGVVRVAILGAGRVAQHYKSIFQQNVLRNFRIVAICDLDRLKADELAATIGGNVYYDYLTMLRSERIDLVLILTPSGCHFEHCKLAINNGKHVLVEKPAAMLVTECEELIELSKNRSLSVGVAFQNRLNPAVILLKKAIESSELGKIISASVRLRWCRYQNYYDDLWHGKWSEDGGVINQQAIHHIDALNWLLGPVSYVCGKGENLLNNLEAEDTFVGVLQMQSGAMVTLEATTAARPRDFEASLSIVSEKGVVEVGGIALNEVTTWDIENCSISESEIKAASVKVPNGYGLSHMPLLQRSIDSILANENKPVVSLLDAMATTKLVHALYRSDEDGRWVELQSGLQSQRLGRKV